MKKDLRPLIDKLQSTDYSDLKSLAEDAYNEAIRDVVKYLDLHNEVYGYQPMNHIYRDIRQSITKLKIK